MLYYVYKTTVIDTDEYYIGKHKAHREDDGYIGSGEGILEKVSAGHPIKFEILEYSETEDGAYELEEQYIGDLWRTDPLCLNRCAGGRRGWTGNMLGKTQSDEHIRKRTQNKNHHPNQKEIAKRASMIAAEKRRGQKDSEETKRKRNETLSKKAKGRPNVKARKVIYIDDKEYLGVAQVTKEYNITRQTVYNRINSEEWNWYYG